MPKDFRPVDARRLIGTGPAIILEIGANDGEDSQKFMQAFNHRRTKLFCFECDPRAIERWKKNVKDIRATLIEKALSDQSGTFTFHQSSGIAPGFQKYGEWDKSGSLLPNDKHTEHSPWMSLDKTVEVEAVALDDWYRSEIPDRIIDFCWVDVQGAELMVLKGAQDTLRRIRYWYCECDPRPNYKGQTSLEELKEFLSKNGFDYQGEYRDYNHLWKNSNLVIPAKDEATVPVKQSAEVNPIRSAVSVRFIGQFGNQLFQYVAGKIASEVSGLEFTPPPFFLTKKGNPVIWSGVPLIQMESSSGEKERSDKNVSYSGEHWIDWDQFKDAGKISFRQGYFQRYECIKPWKEKIKNEWLRFNKPFQEVDNDAVHVHCRRADYVPGVDNPNKPSLHGISTTLDEYMACLDHFPDAKRLVIYTDDVKDPWLQEFRKLGYPFSISCGAWDQDFLSLASCRWLVIAQSTFSWWAGLLGKAEKIACPLSKGTLWNYGKNLFGPVPKGGRDFPNLIVDDEPRWTWVENDEN